MKYWNDFEGSVFFNMVFSRLVEIDEVKLFSLSVDNNASVLTLAFNIKELPDRPPLKWKEFNSCRIGVSCSEVSDLSVKNIPTTSLLKVKIEPHGSRFRISVGAADSIIEFTAAYLRLHDPSVYVALDDIED
ncbi:MULTISPECIES: Imm50 family immunity protein [unclassified Pseudomonas]|uniref:Imm50 family immunity protein n=1 Tax=Pseudomonas sp. MYb327 TaxID=2745230 RepID=A0AAU8E6X8_9PSED